MKSLEQDEAIRLLQGRVSALELVASVPVAVLLEQRLEQELRSRQVYAESFEAP